MFHLLYPNDISCFEEQQARTLKAHSDWSRISIIAIRVLPTDCGHLLEKVVSRFFTATGSWKKMNILTQNVRVNEYVVMADPNALRGKWDIREIVKWSKSSYAG